MAKTFGFGIIGTGLIADFHARAIKDITNARLVAGCDIDRERAEAFAAKYGCRAYLDADTMLADPDIDIVTISTPSGRHLDPVLAAARHRKHVICEKPLEISLDRIDQMIDAHRQAGTVLAGVFQSRFAPLNVLLKKAIEAGRFGRLTFASTFTPWWRTDEYYAKGGWRGTVKLDGGGALMNQSIHMVDLLDWLAGPVRAVASMTARIAHPQIEVEDTAGAVVQFTSGALGLIQGATSMWPGMSRRIEVSGDAGSAVIVEDSLGTWKFAKETDADEQLRQQYATTATRTGSADPAAIDYVGHRRCFESTLAALEAGQPPAISGTEARKAVAIILAIYESAKTGRRVKLGGGN